MERGLAEGASLQKEQEECLKQVHLVVLSDSQNYSVCLINNPKRKNQPPGIYDVNLMSTMGQVNHKPSLIDSDQGISPFQQ